MLPEYFEFSLPTKLIYGIGVIANIGDALKPFGQRKAILVTDEVLVKAGPVDTVKAGFKKTPVKVCCTFSKVPPNSTIKTVEQCAALAKKAWLRHVHRGRWRQRHRHRKGCQSPGREGRKT